jgi:hypothetical protein
LVADFFTRSTSNLAGVNLFPASDKAPAPIEWPQAMATEKVLKIDPLDNVLVARFASTWTAH